ncbi:hypothetical protein K435DRAFT_855124 [Dendrothele bispora CBS 962.96]|uniref:Uncharacterized protein n=1 Tax=Dendrothele bispora (strain CBS 962.96) TaxID=1314807 RepID=A0A4S8MDC9_DENBC|nr:hypothetical protein K435DRAFT_855124 [Dendrothele bispora CBS 962.96]
MTQPPVASQPKRQLSVPPRSRDPVHFHEAKAPQLAASSQARDIAKLARSSVFVYCWKTIEKPAPREVQGFLSEGAFLIDAEVLAVVKLSPDDEFQYYNNDLRDWVTAHVPHALKLGTSLKINALPLILLRALDVGDDLNGFDELVHQAHGVGKPTDFLRNPPHIGRRRAVFNDKLNHLEVLAAKQARQQSLQKKRARKQSPIVISSTSPSPTSSPVSSTSPHHFPLSLSAVEVEPIVKTESRAPSPVVKVEDVVEISSDEEEFHVEDPNNWPRSYYVVDIVKVFADGMKKKGGRGRKNAFEAAFPGVSWKKKRTPFYDSVKRWNAVKASVCSRYLRAGRTDEGLWMKFMDEVPLPDADVKAQRKAIQRLEKRMLDMKARGEEEDESSSDDDNMSEPSSSPPRRRPGVRQSKFVRVESEGEEEEEIDELTGE